MQRRWEWPSSICSTGYSMVGNWRRIQRSPPPLWLSIPILHRPNELASAFLTMGVFVAWGNTESARQHSASNQLVTRPDPKCTCAVGNQCAAQARASHGVRAHCACTNCVLCVGIPLWRANVPHRQMHPLTMSFENGNEPATAGSLLNMQAASRHSSGGAMRA
jgi:hypothetical protein